MITEVKKSQLIWEHEDMFYSQIFNAKADTVAGASSLCGMPGALPIFQPWLDPSRSRRPSHVDWVEVFGRHPEHRTVAPTMFT